jgi:hypothetical protein
MPLKSFFPFKKILRALQAGPYFSFNQYINASQEKRPNTLHPGGI